MSELVIRLRSQANAMKAGPGSLLRLAADRIEMQEQEIADLNRSLLMAAQVVAASISPVDEATS